MPELVSRLELIERSINFCIVSGSLEAETSLRRPGRPRKDEEQGADVRDRLLVAATELAVEQGFERCGLREIAARAEVSSGMISYYFKDRQGLYEAMVQRAFDRIALRIAALAASGGQDGGDAGTGVGAGEGDRLNELVRIQVEALSEDPWLPQLLLRELLANPDAGVRESLGDRMSRGPLKVMREWLQAEQARGVLRSDFDPALMALTVSSLTAFPFLMVSLMGEKIGLAAGDGFADLLTAHNQKILAHGLRAPAKDADS